MKQDYFEALDECEVDAVTGGWFYDTPRGMPRDETQMPRITLPGLEIPPLF